MSRLFRTFRVVAGVWVTVSFLAACGTGGDDASDPDFLVVALDAEAGVELGVAQARHGAGLAFRHFVNDTDDVLVEVRVTGDGELSLVFVAEAPVSGRLGRLVFEQRSSGDASLTVSPLRVAEGSGEIGLATQQEVLGEAPAAKGNPDDLASRSAAAGGLQHGPAMADHPLGDVDADGAVTLEDADALRAILFADGGADDFELYHGDLIYDGTITFADVAQLALKATGDAEPMIHAAPRILELGSGESGYVLVGNAGAGDLPDLEVAGVRGGNPQPVARASALGWVYELTSNGTTMGAVFDAGSAGRAGVLNDLMEVEPHGDQAETALAGAAAAFGDFEALVAYVKDEGFAGPVEETAAILRDDGAMLADVYQAAFDGADGSATVTYIEAHGGQVAYALVFGADGNPTAEARLEGGELVVDELTMATLATGPCLINLGPQQGGDSEAECKRRCRERFCDIDFGSVGLDDLQTPCKVLAYIYCGLGAGGSACEPPPAPTPGCRSCGDPHLYTFDGLAFDFQAAGEFWLVASDAGDLTVQSRQEPVRDSTTVAINTAVAVGVLGDRVVVDAAGPTPLRVNGAPTDLSQGALGLPNGGVLYAEGNEVRISWPDGSVVSAWLRSSRLDIGVELAESRAGTVSGLLGDFDGDPHDDVRPRDGAALSQPLDFAELYGAFGESWRIEQAESLFDYDAGEDTSTYTIPGIPTRFVSAATLSDQDYQAARNTCEAAGVTDPVALENCILDVASTGDASFADSALAAPAAEATLEVCSEPVLVDSDIRASATWGCPEYVVDDWVIVANDAILTVAPGTEVMFREDAGLFVSGQDSAIHAVGTAGAPIIFRAEDDASGSWYGLAFASDSPLNELTHVIVRDGGGLDYAGQNENRSNVFVTQGRLKLSHARIVNSAHHGLKATPGSSLAGFAENRFEDNAGAPMAIATPIIGDLDDASTYAPAGSPNGDPYIVVERDTNWVQTDQTWPSNDVPYRFRGQHQIQSGRVTIAPGAEFEFAADAALAVDDQGGALIANAQGAEAIVFRGAEPGSGWWRGLTVHSTDPGNVLNNVVVSGGGSATIATKANIVVFGALELRNSIIRDSSGYGVYLQNQGTTDPEDPTDPSAGNTFQNIAEEDVGP